MSRVQRWAQALRLVLELTSQSPNLNPHNPGETWKWLSRKMEAAVGGASTEEGSEECQPANHQKSALFFWLLDIGTQMVKNWAQHGQYRPTSVWPLRPVNVKNLAASSKQAVSALANPRDGYRAILPVMLHCQAEQPRFIPNTQQYVTLCSLSITCHSIF